MYPYMQMYLKGQKDYNFFVYNITEYKNKFAHKWVKIYCYKFRK